MAVDRVNTIGSPSSRRAWIEILEDERVYLIKLVALLAEGVDRNFKAVLYKDGKACRPPRGGRG